MRRLFIVGHPGMYGGAATELHHQILLWLKIKDLELHIIPTYNNYESEILYQDMIDRGIVYRKPKDYSVISKNDAVINFCSKFFLNDLPLIHQKTKKIAFVNCMTFVFGKELQLAKKNYISHYLYQRQAVMEESEMRLRMAGARAKFMVFNPYFHKNNIISSRSSDVLTIGRISRADNSKYSRHTVRIYEKIKSPVKKRGIFLGYNGMIQKKIGNPPSWIEKYTNHKEFSVEKFYSTVDILVQPTDTKENLPRVGFECAYNMIPMVVDNDCGWAHIIDHGVSGFLCDNPSEFIYYSSLLAENKRLALEIAIKARTKAIKISNEEVSMDSWMKVFNSIYNEN